MSKFSLDLDFGYTTRFDLGLLFRFEMDILKLEIVNQRSPETTFRFFFGANPSYESKPLTSIEGKTLRENLKAFYGRDIWANLNATGLSTSRIAIPILTLESKGPEDSGEVHLRVTFLMNHSYTQEEALQLVKDMLNRNRSPFVRKAIHYVDWGTPDETLVELKGACRPPASQGPCYP